MANVLPDTRDTLVAALSSGAPADRARAHELLARAYRDPIVSVLTLSWRLDPADAEDLAHEFFATAMEKDWFRRYDPSRGRFRPFLRTCLNDFARSAFRHASRRKRGGDAAHQSLDIATVDAANADALSAAAAVDEHFEAEWRRSVLGMACERLREECAGAGKEIAWRLFERYDLVDLPDDARPTYASLGAEFGEPVTQVTNHLAWARRRMREHVLATVRALTGNEQEYRDEVRALLGADPS